MNAQGQLTEIVDGQGFVVFVPFSDTRLLEKQQITECQVSLDDGRTISREQQKKIFALIDDITVFIRGTVKKTTFYETLREMQMLYLIDNADNDEVRWKLTAHYCNLVNTDRFSLSDIDMTTAREFIDWLVEFCIIHGIPCIDTLLNRCEDTGRYLYACLANKRCCICGKNVSCQNFWQLTVTEEFRKHGHEAWSCDIEPTSGNLPQYHLQQDVIPLLSEKWDMIIAFPPCTYLSNAGARYLWAGGQLNQERYENGLKGKEFFMNFYYADCPRIAIENPVSSRIYNMPPHTQEIEPYMFGHPFSKKTRLWLKGLPPLSATNIVKCKQTFLVSGSYSENRDRRYAGYELSKKSKDRSKTFLGIAQAMAEQWGNGEIWQDPQISLFDLLAESAV